ncbi:PCMD domain-containing protein [Bacteroides caecicola]|uniref:PCMD domain-containing protein n=1 Tax=Bacteroides caecicola TaxID=1462569 RepID=A0ABS2F517_9BACE|nr:PCMD domain-containing protein [Bacteroides caecicola]MBM6805332.1 PCMD domain-containing protein [Bacteroides caecicola]
MKKIVSIICSMFAFVLLMASCQNEDELSNSNVGYLRLNLGVNTSVTTRADEAPYNPEQIGIQIVSADGEVVKETSNWTEWEGQQIALATGTYTLKASSAGFDGATSGFDKPYYAGSAEITIEKDKEVNQTITCTLANVKVTVNFDQSFIDAFTAANVEIDDNADNTGIDPLTFIMGQENPSGYFPVTDLKATVSVTNKDNENFTQNDIIKGVQARDHYILNYKVSEGSGEGNISISVDPSTKEYTYTFYIKTTPDSAPLSAPTANAWAKLVYLTGQASSSELTPENITFQYREKDAAEWTTVAATQDGEDYKATITSLQPNTTYESRMAYNDEQYSEVTEFTTEDATALYNGNFDNWYQADKTWYAVAQNDYNDGNAFWDSGNVGTSTGAAALLGAKNPTSPETNIIHTNGGKSAKLQSQFVGLGSMGKFAAGNLYTGHFVKTIGMSGAEIQFGSPFTARPNALHGWFQYTSGTVDYYGDSTPSDALVQDGGTDMCAIYIALSDADEPYTVNTSEGNFVDYANDPNIIAYGELPITDCVTTSDWKEFTINLTYRDLTRKPKYIIVVASASKYGDYFTGSTGSLMYVDDFSLVYDGEPAH